MRKSSVEGMREGALSCRANMQIRLLCFLNKTQSMLHGRGLIRVSRNLATF